MLEGSTWRLSLERTERQPSQPVTFLGQYIVMSRLQTDRTWFHSRPEQHCSPHRRPAPPSSLPSDSERSVPEVNLLDVKIFTRKPLLPQLKYTKLYTYSIFIIKQRNVFYNIVLNQGQVSFLE